MDTGKKSRPPPVYDIEADDSANQGATKRLMGLFKHPIVEQIPSLRRYARALTGGNIDDADDLVQDALERAYAKWHLWKVGTDLRPWLFSVMHNVYVNQISLAKNRVKHLELDEALEVGVPATQEQRLEARDVVHAVGRLAPELREVLLLVALEDFSYAQAAKILDIPIGTVMSRLSRARARVRDLTGTAPAQERPALKVVS